MLSRRAARLALAPALLGLYASLGMARDLTDALRAAGLLRLSVVMAFVLAGGATAWSLLRDARHRSWQVLAALAGAAALYAAVVFPMDSPEEKLHFIEYGAVGLLAWAAAPREATGLRRFLFAVGFTAAAGWADEGLQGLWPSRHYDLRDVAFNALAGLMSVSTLEVVRRARRALPSGEAAAPSQPVLR